MATFAVWAGTSVGLAVLAALALAAGWLMLRMAGVRRWTTLPDLAFGIAVVGILALTLREGRIGQPTGAWQLLPFGDLIRALPNGPRLIGLALADLIGNIVLFVPFGAAIALRWPGVRVGGAILAAVVVSLCVEIAQWSLPLGRTAQTTDVLMNGLGGLLGWLLVVRLRGSERLSGGVPRRR